MGQPTPLLPQQTSEDLRRGLASVAPSPNTSSSSITDRLARAHHTTREMLKSAAQMTDAYFLFTPSQIWLSAFLLADKPLAEFYIDTKLGGPATNNNDESNPLTTLRTKLFRTLTNCANLLQAYHPVSSDESQMANLRRIAKKLYHCQNPEKANIASQKRIPAAAVAAASGTSTASGTPSAATGSSGASENESERLAKKRKLDANDVFGGELVTERTKERQQQEAPTSHAAGGE